MIYLICALFTAAAAHAQTGPASLQTSAFAFADIKLVDLARFGLSQALGLSFVADDAFLNDTRRVTLDLKVAEGPQFEAVLVELIQDAGYRAIKRDGLVKIRKQESKDDDKNTFIYRPKYRSAGYLMDALGIGTNRQKDGIGSGADSAGSFGTSSQDRRSGGDSQQARGSAAEYLDRSSDVVIVRQTAADLEQTRLALEVLDSPVQQVDVTAVVYEFQTGGKVGSAFSAVVNIAKGKLSGALGAVEAIGDFVRFNTESLQVLLSAIEQDNRFTLISSPNVRVKSGAKSRINVGADVPTLGGTSQNNGITTQNVVYQKTGVVLDVAPVVMRNAIDLNVKQTLSEAVNTLTGVNNTPTLTNREVLTQVSMTSGESIVIGGLQSLKDSKTRSGLSFLPSVLHSKSADDSTTEIVVFLSVRVAPPAPSIAIQALSKPALPTP